MYVVFRLALTTGTNRVDARLRFDFTNFFQNSQPPNLYLVRFLILFWLTNITTDGLFVGRFRITCMNSVIDLAVVAGLGVLYALWRSTGTERERLVYFIVGSAVSCLLRNALWVKFQMCKAHSLIICRYQSHHCHFAVFKHGGVSSDLLLLIQHGFLNALSCRRGGRILFRKR